MPKDDQNLWNFIMTVVFVGLSVGSLYVLYIVDRLPTSMPLFDAVLITLATFRLTRLVVYDKIFQFFRDIFLIKKEFVDEEGNQIVMRQKPVGGLWQTMADLLTCPWCLGVWGAWILSFAYYLTPFAWFFILVAGIAGASTLLQLITNLIGWSAEGAKIEVEQLEEFDRR